MRFQNKFNSIWYGYNLQDHCVYVNKSTHSDDDLYDHCVTFNNFTHSNDVVIFNDTFWIVLCISVH